MIQGACDARTENSDMDTNSVIAWLTSNCRFAADMVRLYRSEPVNLGDGGEWLKKHMSPADYERFLTERGRLFADVPMAQYGHGADTHITYYVDVPRSVAEMAKRTSPLGVAEYLLPPEYVSLKKRLQ